jgi:hypothetical protein
MTKLVYYILLFITGFSVFTLISGPKTGRPNLLNQLLNLKKPFNSLKINGIVFHIHHWIILSFLFLIIDNIYFRVFCLGGIFQGLMYEDWHKIIY